MPIPHDSASGRPAKEFKDNVEQVGDDVGQIQEDVIVLAKDARNAATAGVRAAKQEVRNTLESAKDQGVHLKETLCDGVAKHPMESLAIAAGVGLLLGVVFARRS